MKRLKVQSVIAGVALSVLAAGTVRVGAASEEGIALAILYDASGSMSDVVRDASGHWTPKYKIANRALEAIAKRMEAFANKPVEGSPRKIEAGLFTFSGGGIRPVVPFGKFNAEAMIQFARTYNRPGSGTPLGQALQTASRTVLRSDLSQKHILVITDGMNTQGPDPTEVMPEVLKEAQRKQAKLGVYFVAFDVDAKLFNPVKKLGVKVFSASDEKQLNAQLDYIVQREILLEEPEKPTKN